MIGTGLADLFNQEAVLIHRYTDNETYLLYADEKQQNERRNNKIDGLIN